MDMELDLDESSLAIGRIERALSRVERALANRADRPVHPPVGEAALKAEVAAVIGELDRLIAEAGRG